LLTVTGKDTTFTQMGQEPRNPSLGQRALELTRNRFMSCRSRFFFFLPLASPSQIDLQPIVRLGTLARNWFSFPHIRGPSVTRGETRVGHCVQVPGRFSPLVSLRFYPAFGSSACVDLQSRPCRWRYLRQDSRKVNQRYMDVQRDCRITQSFIRVMFFSFY